MLTKLNVVDYLSKKVYTKIKKHEVYMNKTALITGASRGIGRAVALELAKNGYYVGIVYLNSNDKAFEVKSAALSFGADAEVFQCDVSDPSQCMMLTKSFIDRFGRIDLLVNNAGVSKIATLNDTEIYDWDKIISTNLSSSFYLSKALLPYFLKNKSGNIINISSIWGVNGASCEVAYSASKAGLIGFTKALAKELGPSGIRVNCISPGIIDTEMNQSLDADTLNELINETPVNRIGKPEDVARTVLFLASSSASFITGENIIIDGGFL